MAWFRETSSIRIGRYLNRKTRRAMKRIFYRGERHILIFGLNGAGKSTRFLVELLVTLKYKSLVIFDVKGELVAMTARTRRKFGQVWIINPYNVLDLGSDGYNPLLILNPDAADFFDKAELIAYALIEIEPGSGQFWSESAQGLLIAGLMWEAKQAKLADRAPSLFRVRQFINEPEESKIMPDGSRKMVKGLAVNAARMVMEGGPVIADLASRFVRQHGQNELSGIQSTFNTQTQWLLSDPMRSDLERTTGPDFRSLRDKPGSVFIVLPANEISRKRRWTRLIMTAALCEQLRTGPVKTLFILDEFRASVGNLPIISDVWSLVRGYGIQLMPVVQSATQLKALFKDEWENFAAQAGAIVTIGPPNDATTADFMSVRSGTTTIWQQGANNNEQNNMSGASSSDGLNYSQSERRFLLPQELMNMPVGTGRIWTPGMGDRSIPFFAPNFWKVRELRGMVDPNPYFKANGNTGGFIMGLLRKVWWVLDKAIVVAGVVAIAYALLAQYWGAVPVPVSSHASIAPLQAVPHHIAPQPTRRAAVP